MAQNRRAELESALSSSEEEEDVSSEEQEATESEGEEDKTSPSTPPVTKKPSASKKPATNHTPSVPQSSSSDDSQAESETDSDSPPEKLPKSVEDSSKSTKKPRSEPSAPASKPGAGAKRPAESEAKDSKRAKKTAADDDQKKQLFQRLWSEDDEIAILKGIMEYTSKKGADPMTDMHAFYDFIKKSVHVDVTKNQLAAKVRRLKKKYENNASKEKGKDRTFSKAHEQKAYDLSKKIWGKKANTTVGEIEGSSKVNNGGSEKKNQNQNQRASNAKANGSEKKNQKPKAERVSPAKEDPTVEIDRNVVPSRPIEFSGSIGDVKFQDEMMKNGIELIKGDQKKELDEKWRKQRVLEAEVYLKRLDLVREQMTLVLEALKSEGN